MKHHIGFIALILLTACQGEDTSAPSSVGSTSQVGTETEQADTTCGRTLTYRHMGEELPLEVKVAGDFESPAWSGQIRMSDADGDGFWHANVELDPGRYHYRFIIDGQWQNDRDNPEQETNDAGDSNSVFEHTCPWSAECLSDVECGAETPLCRNNTCVAEETCTCDNGSPCNDEGECPAPECDESTPCTAPFECVDGVCEPECTASEDCNGSERCVNLECIEPECVTDYECVSPLTQECLDGWCEAQACSMLTMTFDPLGTVYNTVHLAGSFNDWAGTLEAGGYAMTWQEDLELWVTKFELEDGAYSYKIVLDESEWIQDPSALATEDDGFGGSNSVVSQDCSGDEPTIPTPGNSVCASEDFEWLDAVMYFAMTDRFYDSDGQVDPVPDATGGDHFNGPSGQYAGGDLRGVTAKLPYLRDLGVNSVWLSAPFENRNYVGPAMDPGSDPHLYSAYHGYWPSPDNINYDNPDSPSPIPAVESRIGTGDDLHELVDSAHSTATFDGNNIKVLFDYVMNHVDIASGLYQEHPEWFVSDNGSIPLCGPQNLWEDPYWGTRCAFTDYLPAFDFYNDAAREWSVRDAIWWAKEYGIDGYRLDAIKHVPLSWLTDLRTALNQNFPDPTGERFYLVGETFSYDDRDLLRSFVNPSTMLDGQFDFPFKARVCEALFSFQMGLDEFSSWMDSNDGFYGENAIMTTWIGNHDIPRPIHFAAGQITNCREGSHPGNGWTSSFSQPQNAVAYERLGLAFAVMLTNPGIPLIYYGDEIGLAGGGDPDNRRMMTWSDSDLNQHQLDLRTLVSKIGKIRQENKVLTRGQRRTISSADDTWVYRMEGCSGDSPDLTVAINRSDWSKTIYLPNGNLEELLTETSTTGGAIELPPRSVRIYRSAE